VVSPIAQFCQLVPFRRRCCPWGQKEGSMKGQTEYETIDEYIALYPATTRKRLNALRQLIKKLVPDAVEKIAYRMPTFYLNGNLVHFAAYAEHIGFYPTPSGVVRFARELSKYKTSKGAIQFPLDEPMPIELLKKIVQFRVKENRSKGLK
jgi:uncharacterized protein YdhG (YjbR/CyaY superfamily)